MHCLWTVCFLTLPLVFGSDLISSYTLKKKDCPKSGFFYEDAVDTKSCFLCFCQNSTATCLRREWERCGEEIHQISKPSGNRLRRSPVSLSDIFFRDSTRDFFQKQLPQECKPHEGSFSDGCPPADWCVGCTVCDCDSNGRWDCHILSFCNGEEKQNKKRKTLLPSNIPIKRVHQNKATPKNPVTPKPKKAVKKPIPKPQHAQRKNSNGRRPNNSVKKPNNNNKRPTNNKRKPNKNVKRPNIGRKPVNNKRQFNKQKPKPRPNQRKPQQKARPKPRPKPTTRKPQRRRFMVKKAQNKPTVSSTKTATTAAYKKIMRKPITSTPTKKITEEIFDEEFLKKHFKTENESESELRRKIVSKMMGTVKMMIGKQMEKRQNVSRVERSTDEKSDYMKNKKMNKKKWKLNNYMMKKKLLNNRKLSRFDNNSLRTKREALDLDLSVIELNDGNLIHDSMDSSAKVINKNVTDFDFNDSNLNDSETNSNKINSKSNHSKTIDLNKKRSILRYLNKNVSNLNASNTYLNGNATNNSTTETTTSIKLSKSTTANQYYKYSIDRNSSTATTKMITAMPTTSKNNSTMNTMVTNKTTTTKRIAGKTMTTTTEFVLISNHPEFNDLKYKKWERMKILRDNKIQVNQITKFNKVNTGLNEYNIDSSVFHRLMNKNNRENVTIMFGVLDKHFGKKMDTNLNTVSNSYINTTMSPTVVNRNMSSIQVLLRNLMKELNNNTTTPSKLKKKFSLFKYLRNLFKNIFSRKKGKHFIGHKTNEAMTLQVLCENVGACYLNKHNRLSLRNKLHDLNSETVKIFRTIKIIKGLLYLIVLPVIKDNSTTKKPLKDEIKKLDAILRGTYGEDSILTEAQASQISYVKDNINQFVESVGKFATLLDDILRVIYKNNKKYSCQRNLRFYSKKKKLNAFNKIKDLLIRYNIVQNTFMQRMYKLLTDVEQNMTTNKPKKVSDRAMNKTGVIDSYSKNIIQNLRKLKELALALSSSRTKRQTMSDDDAIQYLLLLMEYLLKKNQPMDTVPVNDGIDMLIEAIQNAPDIKAIKKKVLDEHTTQSVTRTTFNFRHFNEDSNSDSKLTSKEDNKTSEEETTPMVYYKKFFETDNTTDQPTEYGAKNISSETKYGSEEKVGFDKFESALYDRRKFEVFNTDLEEETIPTVVNSTDIIETTTQIEQTTDVPLHDFKLDEDPVRPIKTKLDWIEENFDKEIKDYNLFNITHTTLATLKPEKNGDNISSITSEVEEEKKKKKNKVADTVMHRKQIEFLNSLDYGTERTEFDDSDLKEDEKFSGDSPSYFVK